MLRAPRSSFLLSNSVFIYATQMSYSVLYFGRITVCKYDFSIDTYFLPLQGEIDCYKIAGMLLKLCLNLTAEVTIITECVVTVILNLPRRP
jgi:hypothetical protein